MKNLSSLKRNGQIQPVMAIEQTLNRQILAGNLQRRTVNHQVCIFFLIGCFMLLSVRLLAQTATAPSSGDGSAGNPYTIATLNNLYWISASSARYAYHYIQTADINASSTSTWNPGSSYAGWNPIGNSTTQFTGSYNGDNHTITGLYIYRTVEDHTGLFGMTANATIKNLKIVSANISGKDRVGILIGRAQGGTIEQCSADGIITGINYVGGLVGWLSQVTNVSCCLSSASTSVTGLTYSGGIFGGSMSTGTISNCYSRASVTRSSGTGSYFGSFIGYNNGSTITNCYCTGAVTYTGATNPTNFGFTGANFAGGYSQNFFDKETTGQTNTCSIVNATGKTTAEMTSYYTYAFTPGTWDFYGETTNGSNDYWGYNTTVNNGYPFLYWEGYTHEAPPYVTTQETASIGNTTASARGTIVKGTNSITQHGHCWSTTANPTTSNSKTALGAYSSGSYSSSVYGLTSGVTYYVRAYAISNSQTFYGNELSFTTTVTKLDQTMDFPDDLNKTYGDASFSLNAQASSGLTVSYTSSDTDVATISGNIVTITGAGETIITASQAGNSTYNAAPSVNKTLTVARKTLTVSGATGLNKTYDSYTDAIITGAVLVGKVGSDDVSIQTPATGYFNSKSVGTGKTITANIILQGTRASHYTLTQPTGLSANITPKGISVTGTTVASKVYDATTAATLSGATPSGLIDGDVAILANHTTGVFANKNVGTAKTVTASMTLTGTDAGNYAVVQPALSGDITALTITVINAVAQNKVYDGTNNATITGATLSGVLGSDEVTLVNGTIGTFQKKTVYNNINVYTSMSLAGTDAGNYTLTQPSGLTANITHKELTITGAWVSPKTYDGNTDATINNATLSGVVGSDDVTLDNDTLGWFGTSSAGTRISVSTAMTLSGKTAVNYTLTQPTNLRGDINAKELTVLRASAEDKIYDGNTTATISGATLSGVLTGDDCTLSGDTRGYFSQSAIGKAISVSTAMSLLGKEAGNYTLTQPTGLTANISQKALSVTAANITKTVGTTYTFSGTEFTASGLVGSDAVTSATISSTGAAPEASVGTYDILISDAVGTGLKNYSISYTMGTMTVENKTELKLTGLTASDKTYDGTTLAVITNYGTLTGVDPSHTVSLVTTASTANFIDKNHDQDKLITVTGLSLDGPDAAQYFIGNQTTTATLHKRPLTLSNFYVDDKVYDGTRLTTGCSYDDDRIDGDDLSFYVPAIFTTKTAGADKTIDINNMAINGGADQNNYYLSSTTGTTTANIYVKEIEVINSTAEDKTYDGTITAIITGATLNGYVSGDAVALSNHTSGIFNSKNIGENKPVSTNMVLTGADAINYELIEPTNLEADITSKELTVSGTTVQSKTYDGTDQATITSVTLNGKVAGEDVQLTNHTTGTFDNKNVGYNKAVSVAMCLTGTDIGNYIFSNPTGLQADILKKTLIVSGVVASNKVYDGFSSTDMTGALLEGVVGNDDVLLSNSDKGYFNQLTVGNNISVSTNMTLTGADISNYLLQQPSGLTASITPKELQVLGANAQNKTYDGNTNATIINAAVFGIITGDEAVLANHTSGIFDYKNTGSNIPVTTSMTLSGSDAYNYTLTQPAGLTASITPAGLTVTGTSVSDKEYDRTTLATLRGATLSGKISGDDVVLTNHTAGTFAGYSVGNNIAVSTSMNIAGTDATNYTLGQPEGLAGSITSKSLVITANDIEKTEGDSYTFAGTELTSNELIQGDEVSHADFLCEGADAAAQAGTYPIVISNATGTGLENYTIEYVNGTMTVSSSVPENFELDNVTLTEGQNQCYNAQSILTIAGNNPVVFASGSSATCIAGQSIRFLPGFHACNGSYVDAHITSTGDFCTQVNIYLQNIMCLKQDSVKCSVPVKTAFPTELSLIAYPNPNNGVFTIQLAGFQKPILITIFNTIGQKVYEAPTNTEYQSVSLTHIKNGIHFIKATDHIKQLDFKIIIK